MRQLRRQSWWMTLLVIIAIMASPVARAFCRAVVQTDQQVAQTDKPCHGEHAGGQTNPLHNSNTSSCAVCMALTSCVPAATLPAPAGRPLFQLLQQDVQTAAQAVPVRIIVGGLGSRAPPRKI